MHPTVKLELTRWASRNAPVLAVGPVADVGAYDINGAVKDVIPWAVGFDVVRGPGVDVVLRPGHVPDEHRRLYGAVTAVSSFQFCPGKRMFREECAELLASGGLLFLTMSSDADDLAGGNVHSTAPNPYGWGDSFRMGLREFREFWSCELFQVERCQRVRSDYILEARRS